MHPNPSFYSEFNGYTLGLLFAVLFMGALWLLGTFFVARVTLRALPADERVARVARFNSTVLSRLLFVLYLVYPGACACARARARACFLLRSMLRRACAGRCAPHSLSLRAQA